MSNLVQEKMSEALRLLKESEKEQTEGATLAQQIEQLKAKSSELLTSAHEKRVIAKSQLEAAESLNGVVSANPDGGKDLIPVASEAPTKKRSGRKAAAAPAIVVAPVPAPATSPKTKKKVAAKPEKGAEKAAEKTAPKKKGKGTKGGTKAQAKAAEEAEEPGKPSLHERLRMVIGHDSVNIAEAIERLKNHEPNWLPESKDLRAYISLALSTHVKDIFERVSRGNYRVRKGVGPGLKKAVTAQKTNGTQNPANGTGTIDDLGNNVMASPFTGAAA